MKKSSIAFLGIIALLVVGFVGALNIDKVKADVNGLSIWTPAGVSTSAACSTSTSTNLLATSTGSRVYYRLTNISSTTAFLALGTNAAVNTGIYLAASSTYENDSVGHVMFMGAINCISSGSATDTISVETIGS